MKTARDKAGITDERFGWHALRRRWATVRKYLSLVDVASAGGWRDTQALSKSYIHTDPDTTLQTVLYDEQSVSA